MSAFQPIKSFIKFRLPLAVAVYRGARQILLRRSLKKVFSEIYHSDAWGPHSETVSGRGSTRERTETLTSQLPSLLKELEAETLLDAPCGDFNWMKYVDLGSVKYIGVDIVEDLISRNRRLYEAERRTFMALDITKDYLPRADIILCRDCLIHLSFKRIHAAIANFKRTNATHILCTTHITVLENLDCLDGDWRSLNLQLSPFNFPPPVKLIVEDPELGKCLGVWRLEDLLV